jgi:transposase
MLQGRRDHGPDCVRPDRSGLAAPGLLAFVAVSKFVEHMPLYRQQDELARVGILLSRSTLCGWLSVRSSSNPWSN